MVLQCDEDTLSDAPVALLPVGALVHGTTDVFGHPGPSFPTAASLFSPTDGRSIGSTNGIVRNLLESVTRLDEGIAVRYREIVDWEEFGEWRVVMSVS